MADRREPVVNTRPALHMTAPTGWLNDPHGITWHGDRYHLFYQAVPDSLEWRREITWGHATSRDLVSWTAHETALTPDEDDFGCWSGAVCESPADGHVTLFYTSVNLPDVSLGVIRTATPVDEELIHWRKGAVVARPPVGEHLHTFRDPDVFRDGDGWRMLVGAGFRDGRAAALSFVSEDLVGWTYDGVFAERSTLLDDPVWTGSAWECPHVVNVDGRDVLLVSVWDRSPDYVAAATGTIVDGRFTAESWARIGFGPGPYAATVFRDSEGCMSLMFWLRETADPDGLWAGAQSIPYRLSVVDDRLYLAPHPQIRAAVRPDPHKVLGLDWWPGGSAPLGVLTLRAADGEPLVALVVDGTTVRLTSGGVVHELPLGEGPVHVLLDTSILEVSTGPAVAGLTVPHGDVALVTVEGEDIAMWFARD